jgi:hypothetical protein
VPLYRISWQSNLAPGIFATLVFFLLILCYGIIIILFLQNSSDFNISIIVWPIDIAVMATELFHSRIEVLHNCSPMLFMKSNVKRSVTELLSLSITQENKHLMSIEMCGRYNMYQKRETVGKIIVI